MVASRVIPDFTIGADPEMFLETNVSKDLRSGIGTVGGRKNNPTPLGGQLRLGYYVQEDNVAVEFNIPPAKDVEEFVDSIQWAVKAVEKDVQRFGLKPRITASELFPLPELRHPEAMRFGCDPDFNAWLGGRINPRPKATDGCLRTCGGHIHVATPHRLKITDMVKCMDLFLGVPSVMMDSDARRRQLYGKAGAFRKTHYNTTSWEYRVLSNFWIQTSQLTRWAYEQTIRALQFGMDKTKVAVIGTGGTELDSFFERHDLMDEIQECINSSDIDLAQKLIVEHELAVV